MLAKLEGHGTRHAPAADKPTLIRRATFDLTGAPPTAAEVENFLADKSADAFSRVVDRLLASPHYGERWGRHWLDIARYSDSKGYVYGREERFFVHAWAYRDWVVRALTRIFLTISFYCCKSPATNSCLRERRIWWRWDLSRAAGAFLG